MFTKFDTIELFYKKLYVQNSHAFINPIESWEEFLTRMPPNISLPNKAPSPIMPLFVENDWFLDNTFDVAIVKNARYCPPFWHRLEFVKIVYVASGSAKLFINDKTITITEGNLCILSPNIKNATFSSHDEDVVLNIILKKSTFEKAFYSILSDNSALSDFFWQMLYNKSSNKVLCFKKKSKRNITEYIHELYLELKLGNESSNIIVKSYVLLIFGMILRLYEQDENALGIINEIDERMSDILKYMREDLAEITLPKLACQFKLSEGYLSRFIKRETGFTFREFLKNLRIHKAADLLANSNCTIEDIAYIVGYSDISRFYRNFKEYFHVTPLIYRNTIRS